MGSPARPLLPPSRRVLPLVAGAVALLVAAPARAGSVVGGADVLGVGGVSRANVGAPAALLTAPATLALVPRFQVQGAGVVGPDRLLGARVYALDSDTGPIALGLGYHYDHSVPQTSDADLPGWILPTDDLSNEMGRTLFGGGLGTSFADRRVGVGLSVTWNQRATRFTEVERWLQGGLSVAGRIGAEDTLILSAAVDNLLDPDHPETPLTMGGGLGWRPVPEFALLGQVDVVTGAFSGPVEVGFGTGAELIAAEVVAIRGGFSRDAARQSDLVAAGLGARSEGVAIDYAAELVVGHAGAVPAGWEDGRLRTFHTLSLTLSF